MEPSSTPPAQTPPADNNAAVLETLSKLNESISGISERIETFETRLDEMANPPAPEPPAPPEGTWLPKKWDEFPDKAREVAEEVVLQREAEKAQQEELRKKESEAIVAQIDADFDTQLLKAEKEGMIPGVKDVNDPNDPGKIARKELFALGIRYNTPDLVAMAQMRNDYLAAGYTYDLKENKLIRSNPAPFGANAPVGSSARASSTPNRPTYKEIHNLSMDEIVRRYNQ